MAWLFEWQTSNASHGRTDGQTELQLVRGWPLDWLIDRQKDRLIDHLIDPTLIHRLIVQTDSLGIQLYGIFLFLSDTSEKKQKPPPRQFPSQPPPPWIPKPEVSVVSVQPQDTSIKDDDEIPYSSSDEEPMPVITLIQFFFSYTFPTLVFSVFNALRLCRKIKIIPSANQRKRIQKRGKTEVSKPRLVLASHLIGWEGGGSFINQSQSEVKRSQFIPRLLSTLTRRLL